MIENTGENLLRRGAILLCCIAAAPVPLAYALGDADIIHSNDLSLTQVHLASTMVGNQAIIGVHRIKSEDPPTDRALTEFAHRFEAGSSREKLLLIGIFYPKARDIAHRIESEGNVSMVLTEEPKGFRIQVLCKTDRSRELVTELIAGAPKTGLERHMELPGMQLGRDATPANPDR